MVKSDPDTIMDATATAHFSGLHFDDEYPVPMYKGANKVPFVIGERRIDVLCWTAFFLSQELHWMMPALRSHVWVYECRCGGRDCIREDDCLRHDHSTAA